MVMILVQTILTVVMKFLILKDKALILVEVGVLLLVRL